MVDPERWRVFIAVELSPDVRAGLAGPLAGLTTLGPVIRSSPPEGIHLTLHFLGQVEVQRLDDLSRRLEPVLAAEPSFTVEVRGVGVFPTPGRPKVVWAGMEGSGAERLKQIQATLGKVLTGAGFALEERAYTPHLTLGRLRRPATARERAALRHWKDEWLTRSLGDIRVDAVNLMRSELSSGPPRYSVIRMFGLR